MARASCPGTIQTDASGYPFCTDDVGTPLTWVEVADFDLSELETADLGGAFAAGFVIVGTAYVIGLAARTLIRAVRSL